jgi:hypothetical protein
MLPIALRQFTGRPISPPFGSLSSHAAAERNQKESRQNQSPSLDANLPLKTII